MKRTPLKRKTRLNPVSKKRRGLTKARQDTRRIVLDRDMNRCQAQLMVAGCTFHATDVHEIKSRARGGSIVDVNNCISLCRSCHSWLTTHPAMAERFGFSVPAWADDAMMRAAERTRAILAAGLDYHECDDYEQDT